MVFGVSINCNIQGRYAFSGMRPNIHISPMLYQVLDDLNMTTAGSLMDRLPSYWRDASEG